MGQGHSHGVRNYNRAFAIGVILNVGFVIIEAVYGLLSNSLSLLADAGHNLSDVLGLLLAWGASWLATKAVSQKRTYGFKKVTVLASLISAVLLILALAGILYEALERFKEPHPVEGMTVIVVAGIGVLINTATALLFMKDQKNDLNIRGAFLHMAADAIVSLGVVIAGIVILYKGWLWVDPLVSIVIAVVIFIGTWGLLRDSVNYTIDAVPKGVETEKVKAYLMGLGEVESLHDLHIWPLSTTETALSVHLVLKEKLNDPNTFLHDIQEAMHVQFDIEHTTVQIEEAGRENHCLLKEER
ncbi:cation diffusion facilitator family transporter [Sulfurovum riftiae]|uniref:Cobalt transporter n=1 Tax=Sulfurovum riftiae TaxID=1630136 RepID=A0A151CIA0_9BACT|nr:cation diffusion facilitator family transporter [Sulfurovum riftiae]KYJ87246.1 cobalt transporter [Sulfurovum riftiae]